MKLVNLCFLYDLESPYKYITDEIVNRINGDMTLIPINCGSVFKQCGNLKDINNVINDNGEENISNMNPYVGEMTGLFHFVKNMNVPDDVTHIGTCNYRRFFKKSIIERFSEFDIIDMYNKPIYPKSILDQYNSNKNHSKILFKTMIDLLDKQTSGMASRYFQDNMQIFKQANMFIMRKDLFYSWAEFIINMMDISIKIVNPEQSLKDKSDEDKRIISFVLERLTSFWIDFNVISNRLKHTTEFQIDFFQTKPW